MRGVDLAEGGNRVLGESVGEVLAFGVWTQVDEGQHGQHHRGTIGVHC